MPKKVLEEDEEETVEEEEVAPRISHDYRREDLNDLRDVVNELWVAVNKK